MSLLGDRLKKARERRGLSQTEVYKRTGINNKTISRYEQGGTEPDVATLNALATLYDVTTDWLTGREQTSFLTDPQKLELFEAIDSLNEDNKKFVLEFVKRLEQK